MFTVMGITGNVGGAVAENLLAAGKKVRGVVRNAEKAKAWADKDVELVQSAYDDPAALASAFTGAEGVFAMIPPDFAPAPGLPDQKRTIAAIRKALEQAKPGKAGIVKHFGKIDLCSKNIEPVVSGSGYSRKYAGNKPVKKDPFKHLLYLVTGTEISTLKLALPWLGSAVLTL